MKKITVMHILNSNAYSGAENVVISLINRLQNEVRSVYVSRGGTIREVLQENKIEFYSIHSMSYFEINRIVKEVCPDIIHAHDFTAGIITAISVLRIPIISHLHNNSPWLKVLCIKSIVYGLSCIRYKKILTVSNSIMDEYIFGRIEKKKTEVFGNPIDLQKIREQAALAENNKGEYDIVFLGRISLQKNPHLFLDIMDSLIKKKRMHDLKIAIIGEGELYKEIEIRIKKLGLRKNITLFGFQKNPYGILQCSKILCMPSSWEGFGLAAVEAMALGKPVIASPVGGLVDIINDSCGKLCKSKEGFVEAIYDLLTNEQKYEEKSWGAYKRADDFDNIDQYSKMILKVYQNLIK